MENWRKEEFKGNDKKSFDAPNASWLTYHVIGRIHTWWENAQMNRQNRLLRKRREAAAENATNPTVEPGKPSR